MKNNYEPTVRNLDTVRVFTLVFALLPFFVFGCASKFQAADALYEQIYALYKKKDYKEAIVKYKALIRQFPGSEWADDAQYWIGMSHFELKNYDASRRAFTTLLDDFPNSELMDDAQYNIGWLFYDELMYEEAYQEFMKFSTQEFKNYPAFQAIAKLYAASCSNNFDEKLNLLHELIEHFPESEWVDNALLLIGEVNFGGRDFEKALNAYTSISEGALAMYANIGIANSHFALKNWNKAISTYERIIEEHKEHKKAADVISKCSYQIAEAYYKLATKYREDGEKERASEHFEKALEQYKKVQENFSKEDEITFYALQGMIWVLNDLGRKDEAEALSFKHYKYDTSSLMLSNAVSQDDLTGLSYFSLALNQEKHLKDYEKALGNYGEAIEYVKSPFIKAQSYYRRGLIYQNKLNPPNSDEASKVFKDLISEYPNSENPNVASVVADAKIRQSELSEKAISQEEKRNLIDQKTLVSTVFLMVKDAKGNHSGGSGFFVGPGQIATNYHVVDTAVEGYAEPGVAVLASGEENTKYDIQGYTAVDVESDLIILRVSEKYLSPPELLLGNSDDVKRTNPVYAVGTPLGKSRLKGTRTPGVVSNIIRDDSGKTERFLMTAPISPGSSGGPVLNDNGEVVGVATTTYLFPDPKLKINRAQNLNEAIPSNNLEALRKQIGPPKPLWQLHPLWQLEVFK